MNSQPLPNSSNPTESELLDLKQRQITLLRQKVRLVRDFGLVFYRPHYKQHLFHASSAKRRGLFTGNRFGKSQSSCAETCAWALGERPWYRNAFDILEKRNGQPVTVVHHPGGADHPLVRQNLPQRGTKQLILTTDWDKVKEVWTGDAGDRPGKLWLLLPRSRVTGQHKNHAGVIDEVEIDHRSTIRFDTVESFKRNPMSSESSDYDRIACDEPVPEDMWKANSRGLIDRHGQGDFTLTALRERWMWDYFYSDEQGTPTYNINDRFAQRGTIYDNPYLDSAAIAEFERDLTDDEKACRLNGIPLELSGLVYKEFKTTTHVLQTLPAGWKDWHLPPKNWVLYCRIDPHPRTPHAVLFCAVGPNQSAAILCHEIFLATDAVGLANAIRDYVALTGCFLAEVKCDPIAWIPDSVTRVASIAETLADAGILCVKASKDLVNGILCTRSVLKDHSLLVAPTLRRFLWEIHRYCYDDENKPVDKDDHMMENLRRFCIDFPLYWFDPDGASGSRIAEEAYNGRNLSSLV